MPANLEKSTVASVLGLNIENIQFSIQSQRLTMPENVQTTTQLHLFHMLARKCSKSLNLGFYCMWTKNFQMYELDLEKAQEPEIKMPTFTGS